MMAPNHPETEQHRTSLRTVVHEARRRVNRGLLGWSLAVAAAAVGGASFVAAASFALSGSGVPPMLYLVAVATMVAACLGLWLVRRRDDHEVAQMIDERFGLDDGVRTSYAFEQAGRDGGFERRQMRWTLDRLRNIDTGNLAPTPGRRLLAGAIALPVLAGLLALAPESRSVIEAREERVRTIELAQQLNDGIEQLVEDEVKSATEEEHESLEPESLREMVEELDVSPEKADLLRQYAAMEQDLTKKARGLESPALDTLLDHAAAELATAPETAKLAEALAQRRLDQGATELEEFKIADDVAPESLEKKKAQLERLKKLATRLAEAARRHQAAGRNSGSRTPNNAAHNEGGRQTSSTLGAAQDRDGDDAENGESCEADGLMDEIDELERAVEEVEKSMSQCKNGSCNQSDLDRLSKSACKANDSLGRLAKDLKRSAARRSSQRKLLGMRQTLSQCQACVTGQCSNPFNSGQRAGQGSAESERTGVEREDGMQADLAAGTKASGPATTTIEEAESGDGIATRQTGNVVRDYARQFESFVDRPDVPDEVKEGVKLYLESIHRAAGAAASETEGSE